MFPAWNEQFLTYIGVVAQTSSVILLAVVFLLLLRIANRRGYFVLWVCAWLAKGVALLAVLPYIGNGHLTLSIFAIEAPEWSLVSVTLYLFGSLFFLACLLAGVLLHARKVSIRRPLPWLIAGIVLYTALLVRGSVNVLDMSAWLAPPTVIVALYCAGQMLRLPRQRRSLGTWIMAGALLLLALAWTGYFFAFRHMAIEEWHAHAGWRLALTEYNGFIDLLVELMLAIGMVMILLEDTIRELRSAYRELGASHAELQREAFFDPLTGALNRRAFEDGFSLEAAVASFGTIAMLDIDNLKPVNDEYGHAAGDRLLRSLANQLQASLRPTDKLFRWGGDEFLLILPRSEPITVEQRLRKLLDDLDDVVTTSNGKRVQLTASLGTAPYEGGETFDAAIRAADVAMYEDKRNRKGDTERGNTTLPV